MTGAEPWFAKPELLPEPGSEVLVLGAGLAGCSVSFSLAKRGFKVRLLEARSGIAMATSGHPSAVVFPQIAKSLDPLSQFFLKGYRHSLHQLATLRGMGHELDWRSDGVVHLAVNQRLSEMVAGFERMAFPRDLCRLVDREQASDLAGIPLPTGGFFYPQAVALNPVKLCKVLLAETGITPELEVEVRELTYHEDGWHLHDGAGKLLVTARWVVLATAQHTRRLKPVAWLPVTPLRGQLAYLQSGDLNYCPRRVVCHEGYFIPHGSTDGHLIGATFDPDNSDRELSPSAHERLLRQMRQWLGEDIFRHWPALAGRVAFRCVTNDHLPLIGPVPRIESFLEAYEGIRHGRVRDSYPPAPYWPGLFVTVGHAARGTVSAPIAGEIVASYLSGEALSVEPQVLRALLPARFIMRALRRNKLDDLLRF